MPQPTKKEMIDQMHSKFSQRISAILSQRKGSGGEEAAKEYIARVFSKITDSEQDEILEVVTGDAAQ